MHSSQPKRLGPPSQQRVRRWLASLPDTYVFDVEGSTVSCVCPVAMVAEIIHPEYRASVGLTIGDGSYRVRYVQREFPYREAGAFVVAPATAKYAEAFDALASDSEGHWHNVTAAEVRRALRIRRSAYV